MSKHLNVIISGAVQNVGFRWHAKNCADKIGISGFVRNQDDGTVYIEAEGSPAALDNFLNWCRQGPDSARVEKIETSAAAVENFSGFEIKR